MKANFTKPTASSSNHAKSKRVNNASKPDLLHGGKPPSSKTFSKQPPPLQPTQRQIDCQENVRLSLVSVDQANKANPQCVAVYCEKIFQRFLSEEVSSAVPLHHRRRFCRPAGF